jgi:hypothetical protein
MLACENRGTVAEKWPRRSGKSHTLRKLATALDEEGYPVTLVVCQRGWLRNLPESFMPITLVEDIKALPENVLAQIDAEASFVFSLET